MATETRRVRMTKQLLYDSLIETMEQKPVSRITVKEICERADVNRSTFYVYFKDPADQLAQLEQTLIDRLAECLNTAETKEAALNEILDYIEQHRKMFQTLFGPSGDPSFQRSILSYFGSERGHEHRPETYRAMKHAYQYIFCATGVLGMIIDWVLNEDSVETTTLAKWIVSFTEHFRQ